MLALLEELVDLVEALEADPLPDRVLPGVLLQLVVDGLREVDAGDVAELDEIDRHIGDLFRDPLPVLRRETGGLLGSQPLEELEKLGGFDGDRSREVLGVMKLLPAAVVPEFPDPRNRLPAFAGEFARTLLRYVRRRRRKKLTMASRMIAPRNETKSEPMLKSPWLMVPVWNSGASSRPPRNAPTMPTTMLRMMPCLSFVFMTMLASQPRMPPTMSHMMKVIYRSVK